MYDYLIGMVIATGDSMVVLENSGVGYEIQVPHSLIPDLEGERKLYIHEHVSETEHTLYGFPSRIGKIVFRLLIGVTGVGPKMGIRFFEQFTPEEILQLIASKNIAELKKVKGLGVKTAEKLLIELHKKGKDIMLTHSLDEVTETTSTTSTSVSEESIAALLSLGYKELNIRPIVHHMIDKLQEQGETTSEEVIKKVLEKMAKLK